MHKTNFFFCNLQIQCDYIQETFNVGPWEIDPNMHNLESGSLYPKMMTHCETHALVSII